MNDIKLFENNQIRSVWDAEKEEWFFSVVDIVQTLTGSANPRRYWSDLKRKLQLEEGANELYEKIVQLKFRSSDGKMYKTDATDNRRFGSYKFRRQVPIGNYIVDFVCYSQKLIIELDGSQHFEETALSYDEKRTKQLEELGFKVIRFTNNDVNFDLDNLLTAVYCELSGEI